MTRSGIVEAMATEANRMSNSRLRIEYAVVLTLENPKVVTSARSSIGCGGRDSKRASSICPVVESRSGSANPRCLVLSRASMRTTPELVSAAFDPDWKRWRESSSRMGVCMGSIDHVQKWNLTTLSSCFVLVETSDNDANRLRQR